MVRRTRLAVFGLVIFVIAFWMEAVYLRAATVARPVVAAYRTNYNPNVVIGQDYNIQATRIESQYAVYQWNNSSHTSGNLNWSGSITMTPPYNTQNTHYYYVSGVNTIISVDEKGTSTALGVNASGIYEVPLQFYLSLSLPSGFVSGYYSFTVFVGIAMSSTNLQYLCAYCDDPSAAPYILTDNGPNSKVLRFYYNFHDYFIGSANLNNTILVTPPVYTNWAYAGSAAAPSTMGVTYNLAFVQFPDFELVRYGDVDNQILQSIKDQTAQDKEFHDQDRDDAGKVSGEASGMVSKLQGLKDMWSILWFPIEFFTRLIQVFGSSTADIAMTDEGYITAYTYDEYSGCMVPIYANTRAAGDSIVVPSGAVITFPEYTLPGLNVKVWDSYSFDLNTVKNNFPLVFNGLYIVSSILEVFWFVDFLVDKYEDVFGGK